MRRILLVFGLILFAVYSSAQIISNIRVIGNSKTKTEHIIKLSQLKIGDSVKYSNIDLAIEKARNYLLNSNLFNDVKLQSLPVDDKFTEILIQVAERWYLWPIPDLEVHETNFNTWLKSADLKRLSYGIDLAHQNINGSGGQLLGILRLGYIQAGGIEFRQPYLGKSNFGIDLHVSYTERSEIVYATDKNLRLFYTNVARKKILERSQAFSSLYYRFRPNAYLKIKLAAANYKLDDSLARLNQYFPNGSSESTALTNELSFRSDGRDRQFYPLQGYYFDASYYSNVIDGNYYGIAKLDLRSYQQLTESIYYAAAIKTKIALTPDLPYYLFESLGYDQYVRGYESYVIDGAHFGLIKTNIKFKILDQMHVTKTGFPPKFNAFPVKVYANFFADAAYVSGKSLNFENNLQETLLSGIGLGIDLATLYDRVLRVEFAYNKLNEAGLFVHFTQPL